MASGAEDLSAAVADAMRQVLGPDVPLDDPGPIDSLVAVGIAAQLRRSLGVRLKAPQVLRVSGLDELVALVEQTTAR
jgi:hypothetical protein